MPSSSRSEPPAPSTGDPPQSSKRAMSDAEPTPQGSKKPRTDGPRPRRDSSRTDAKRRRRRKKKAPVVDAVLSKSDQQSRPEDRPRPPLSARNEIIRFISPPPSNIDSASSSSSQAPSSNQLEQACPTSPQSHVHGSTQDRSDATPSHPVDTHPPESSSATLDDEVARLEAELKSKNNLIASHQALLSQIQQAATCQVCLDLMYKPYALSPCGHLVCHTCLVSWFTAPPPDNRTIPPPIMRKKTCPHCRAIVRDRPIEVWGVKGIAQAIGRSELTSNPSSIPVPVDGSEGQDAGADPWKDIFPKPGANGRHALPWFLPDDGVDEDDIPSRGEDVGMLDMEDGGIYRCLDCMHEIWDGVCSSCGRVYPGHRHDVDDDDELGWIDDQIGAEEVDVAEDPSWMGLEDGDADDGGDFGDWGPLTPWRDDEDEEDDDDGDDLYDRMDGLRAPEEGEDDGYESSFIDDDDEGGEARIYEIGADSGEDSRDEREISDVPELSQSGHGQTPVAVLFEEEYYSPDDREEDEDENSDFAEPRRSACLSVSSEEADDSPPRRRNRHALPDWSDEY